MFKNKQLTIENYISIEQLSNEVGTLEVIVKDEPKKINTYIGKRLVQAIEDLEHGTLWDMWNYYVTIKRNGLATKITYTIL